MKVIATAAGFFGKVRKEGEEFEVPPGTKGSWFVPVDKAIKLSPAETKAAKEKADAEAKAAKEKAEAEAKAAAEAAAKGNDLV